MNSTKPVKARKSLDSLVRAWHADNRGLFGADRAARQRILYDALAAVGGKHTTADGTLLAVCDDISPHVAVFEPKNSQCGNCLSKTGNLNRLKYLHKINARRFGAGKMEAAC